MQLQDAKGWWTPEELEGTRQVLMQISEGVLSYRHHDVRLPGSGTGREQIPVVSIYPVYGTLLQQPRN
jgi:hypothetical protein